MTRFEQKIFRVSLFSDKSEKKSKILTNRRKQFSLPKQVTEIISTQEIKQEFNHHSVIEILCARSVIQEQTKIRGEMYMHY